MPPLFPATLAFYGFACLLYFAYTLAAFRGPADLLARLGRYALIGAFALHALDIGWRCTHGIYPVENTKEVLSFAGFLMTAAFLGASLRFKIPVVGALVVPVVMVLDLGARLVPAASARGDGVSRISNLGLFHISMASAGIALFAIAAGGAVVYLVEERRLKHNGAGLRLRGGLALETLDRFSRRCIMLGFPIFTIAMITGAIWVARRSDTFFTPQYAASTVAWLSYAALIIARLTAGWRGRRASWLTIAGFVFAIGALLLYVARDLTG